MREMMLDRMDAAAKGPAGQPGEMVATFEMLIGQLEGDDDRV